MSMMSNLLFEFLFSVVFLVQMGHEKKLQSSKCKTLKMHFSHITRYASYIFIYEQKEMDLDEALVVQQLRYTGMLETVRIRRSGYGAKYTFQVPKSYSSFRKIHVIITQQYIAHTYQTKSHACCFQPGNMLFTSQEGQDNFKI